MNRKDYDTGALGITYQMSLDSFLKEDHHAALSQAPSYENALEHLRKMKKYRSWEKKRMIAKQALLIHADCIEAYLALGLYTEDIFETLTIYKEGMELATMNLGKDYFQQSLRDFYEVEEAKVFFHMKFSYACILYELGFMRKAQKQFQDMIALNPKDNLNVRYYLYATYLYFEEFEKFKELNARYPQLDTFRIYACFLFYYKKQQVVEARNLLASMKEQNLHLYEVLSFEKMNTFTVAKEASKGSMEEGAYCYAILQKVILTLEHLPDFLANKHK